MKYLYLCEIKEKQVYILYRYVYIYVTVNLYARHAQANRYIMYTGFYMYSLPCSSEQKSHKNKNCIQNLDVVSRVNFHVLSNDVPFFCISLILPYVQENG